MLLLINVYDFEKINILEYAFGEGGGGHQKAYAVYAFINVDNCERPLTYCTNKILNAIIVQRFFMRAWRDKADLFIDQMIVMLQITLTCDLSHAVSLIISNHCKLNVHCLPLCNPHQLAPD